MGRRSRLSERRDELVQTLPSGSGLIESSDDNPDMAVFKNGSDYTFEKKGKFTLVKNVVVEKGAKLKIQN